MQTPRASRRQRRLARATAAWPDSSLAPRLPLLWLQPCHAEVPPRQLLKRRLAKLGFCVETADVTAASALLWPHFEFIVICVPDQLHDQVPALLACIRASSHAPVVVLAEASADEWSLAMVRAGADAVLDQVTPETVILARCIALLRRWRPDVFRFNPS